MGNGDGGSSGISGYGTRCSRHLKLGGSMRMKNGPPVVQAELGKVGFLAPTKGAERAGARRVVRRDCIPVEQSREIFSCQIRSSGVRSSWRGEELSDITRPTGPRHKQFRHGHTRHDTSEHDTQALTGFWGRVWIP